MMRFFPFTKEGRQTLVYLTFAGAGPALTVIVVWAMAVAQWNTWQDVFANLAYMVATGMLIIVTGLAMFVSIRSLKVSRDGLEASGGDTIKDGDTVVMNKEVGQGTASPLSSEARPALLVRPSCASGRG